MTTTTDLAAALLKDVPRYALIDGPYGPFMGRATSGEYLHVSDVSSALTAALDGVDERAGEVLDSLAVLADMADLFSAPLLDDDDKPEMTVALERIVAAVPALLAQNAALRAERDASNELGRAFEEDAGQQRDRAEAAEAEVEKLRGALNTIFQITSDGDVEHIARAALTTEASHE